MLGKLRRKLAKNCAELPANCARAPAAARRLHFLGDGLAVGVVGARREVADVELGEALEPAARDDAAQVVERRRRVEVALEEALRRSRDELGEGRKRLAAAESALRAYESELLEGSGLAIAELSATCDELIARRDERMAELGEMRQAASSEATAEAERIAVERERLCLDASRLSNDETELDAASTELEAEIDESASVDVTSRAEWAAKREDASARVAALKEQLALAEEEERACAGKVAEYDACVEATRATFSKQLNRISLRREALAAKLGAVDEANLSQAATARAVEPAAAASGAAGALDGCEADGESDAPPQARMISALEEAELFPLLRDPGTHGRASARTFRAPLAGAR